MPDVYVNRISKVLPNKPVSNDEMEGILGLIDGKISKARRLILRSNKINTRYYCVDKNRNITHTNAQLTKDSIDKLFDKNFSEDDIEVLSCGTTTPDHLLPSHAAMVHGLFNNKSFELNSSSGICTSGMNALKFGFLSVKSGNTKNAVCTASERFSTWMMAEKFDSEAENLKLLKEKPIIAFKKEFLRWMLSDGASAILLEDKPKGDISLKIEWMEAFSYAHELETCMYAGGDKQADGSIKSWSEYHPNEWLSKSVFSLKQDVKLLGENILQKGVESMDLVLKKHNINPSKIDYFLTHISSLYFKDGLKELMDEKGINVPESSWFLNLDRVGNIGAASIYIMIEEVFNSKRLKKGDSIFACVPESGRFSYAYAYLTVC
jgi:3-oxoacyl-[acyl-carrier-protein] synthase-3